MEILWTQNSVSNCLKHRFFVLSPQDFHHIDRRKHTPWVPPVQGACQGEAWNTMDQSICWSRSEHPNKNHVVNNGGYG